MGEEYGTPLWNTHQLEGGEMVCTTPDAHGSHLLVQLARGSRREWMSAGEVSVRCEQHLVEDDLRLT